MVNVPQDIVKAIVEFNRICKVIIADRVLELAGLYGNSEEYTQRKEGGQVELQ